MGIHNVMIKESRKRVRYNKYLRTEKGYLITQLSLAILSSDSLDWL